MSTDWRALCDELLQAWEIELGELSESNRLCRRARAALAAEANGPAVPDGREPASVVGEPSDEELDVLADEWLDWNLEGHRAFARAVLARYGHQPAPPAEGEVGELVQWLKSRAGIPASPDFPPVAAMLTRAADLLERQAVPVPVAWCRRDEFANAMKRGGSFNGWKDPGAGYNKCDMQLYALPLPRGEVGR